MNQYLYKGLLRAGLSREEVERIAGMKPKQLSKILEHRQRTAGVYDRRTAFQLARPGGTGAKMAETLSRFSGNNAAVIAAIRQAMG